MPEATLDKAQVISYIENLTLLEVKELVDELKERLGVSDMPAMAVAAAGPAAAAAPVEEKTEFDVILTGTGDKKIAIIKEVRAITGLGLKEAKDLVEALPAKIKEAVSKDEAEKLKKQLVDAGATIELK